MPSYLLDNDLSRDIATALRLFDFNIEHMSCISQFQNRSEGVGDPEIIDWCRDNGRVWITHDYQARKSHEADMKAAHICVVWIRGGTQEGATWLFSRW